MLRYAQSYRSPFNGPRWGALIVTLLITTAQITSALHIPVTEIAAGDYCCPGEIAQHHAAAPAGNDCCPSETAADSGADGNAAAHLVVHDDCDACSDDCDSGECDSGCCQHPPLTSPLPVPARQLTDASATYVAAAILFPDPKDRPAPFQPPRA